MENTILHDFEISSKQALVIFYFIGTLNCILKDSLLHRWWKRGAEAGGKFSRLLPLFFSFFYHG